MEAAMLGGPCNPNTDVVQTDGALGFTVRSAVAPNIILIFLNIDLYYQYLKKDSLLLQS